MKDNIQSFVCCMQELESEFVRSEATENAFENRQSMERLPELWQKLQRHKCWRTTLRTTGAVAAVFAILLLLVNAQDIAQGAQQAFAWVQQKVSILFRQEKEPTFVPDTEAVPDTEDEISSQETKEELSGKTEEELIQDMETGDTSLYANRSMYDTDARIVQSDLWLPEVGDVCIVCFTEAEDAVFAMFKEEEDQFLYEIDSKTRWDVDNRYQRLFVSLKDCNADGNMDLIIYQVYSDETSTSCIRGEKFVGTDDGFCTEDTFFYDTGMTLGYQPASYASGYEDDICSVSWEPHRLSIWYEDWDSVAPEENHNFYAWCEEESGTWNKTELDEMFFEQEGTKAYAVMLWHRDLADGTSLVVRDNDAPHSDMFFHIAWTDEGVDETQTSVIYVQLVSGRYISACYFADAQNGYIAYTYEGTNAIAGRAQGYPLFYQTNDGGKKWQLGDLGLAGDVYDENGQSVDIWESVYSYGEVHGFYPTKDGVYAGVALRRREDVEISPAGVDEVDILFDIKTPTFEELTGQ